MTYNTSSVHGRRISNETKLSDSHWDQVPREDERKAARGGDPPV